VRRLVARPEAALFALVLVAYSYFYQAGGWNQNSRFDLTRAVVERGTTRIDKYHKNTGDKARREGHYYCDKAPGVSLLAVPAYALTRAIIGPSGDEKPTPRFLADAAFTITVWSIGVPSALSVLALCMLLAALGVGLRARLAVAAAYALATLAFPYSTLLYGHQLCAAMTLGAFALLVRFRPEPSPRVLFAAGFLLGGAVMVEYPSALAGLVIAIYAATFVRPYRRLAWLAAGAALPGIALAIYHWVSFGGPLTLPYEFSTQKHRSMGFFMGLGVPDLGALGHILVTPYRGLFYSAPWLALAIPGAVRWWRAARRPEVIACAAIVLLHIWLNASLVDWEGGWTLGPRYLVPCIPFLAVLAAGLALPTAARPPLVRAGWGLAAAAAIYSAFLMLAGTSVKPEVPIYERRPFGNYLVPHFLDGKLGTSTQSIDSVNAPPNSPVRAWNLGHRMGLDGLASLLPLAAMWMAGAAWVVYAVRCRERSDLR
jgi:hypothetical protein